MRLATYIDEYFYNCLQIKNVYQDPRLKVETQRRFVRERGRSNSSKARFFFREHAALCSIIYFSLLLFLPLGNISSFLFSYISLFPLPFPSILSRSLSPLMALSCPLRHRSSSPSKQGLLSFNRARDEIFEIGYTMTTIRLWYALEMNSCANDRFDFRPIYEPHSLVPRILLEEEKNI